MTYENNNKVKINGIIDLAKVVMAVLVIGIHTQPFGFNYWLDNGFGIITRLCVPFFFITSAYFFWIKDRPLSYIKRIVILYVIWSIIYLPFDIQTLKNMSVGAILKLFLWDGNEHALWYLWGSVIGFVITYALLKFMKPKAVVCIAMLFLLIGTLKSTYAVVFERSFSISVSDFWGSRNGLFYAFPYISMGMYIAKSKNAGQYNSLKKPIFGFCVSFVLLAVESFVFVYILHAWSTILWLSVAPATYFLFLILLNSKLEMDKEMSLTLRQTSTLMYVSQFLFIPLLERYFQNMELFFIATLITAIFSLLVIIISKIPGLKFLKYLY